MMRYLNLILKRMSYYALIGEGSFAVKTRHSSRKTNGKWFAKFSNPYFDESDPESLTEDGFFRIRKNRKFSLYMDDGDQRFNKKTDQLLSAVKLSKGDYKRVRKAETGNIFFEYANWDIHPDNCSSEYNCWGEAFSYQLISGKSRISGTINIEKTTIHDNNSSLTVDDQSGGSSDGGGLFLDLSGVSSQATISKSTISDNMDNGDGGGAYLRSFNSAQI